ncbi:sodium transporter, partial [Staphylococcus aureus]
SLKTLYRKRTVIWPFYFYTIIRTLSKIVSQKSLSESLIQSSLLLKY